MRANEFRIGNWFRRTHGKGYTDMQIDVESLMEILSPDQNIAFDDFHPIPLTEEWLLKFGFKKMTNFKSPHFDKYPIEVCFDGVKPLVTLEFDSTVTGYYSYDCPIEFVHQLQNLFSALTGEELENT